VFGFSDWLESIPDLHCAIVTFGASHGAALAQMKDVAPVSSLQRDVASFGTLAETPRSGSVDALLATSQARFSSRGRNW